MGFIEKAKTALSSIGDETIAEASFEKEQKEQEQKKKKTISPKVRKVSSKPKKRKEKPEEELTEIVVPVETTEYDTFSDHKDNKNYDFLEEDDDDEYFEDDDVVEDDDIVEDDDDVEEDTVFVEGSTLKRKRPVFEVNDNNVDVEIPDFDSNIVVDEDEYLGYEDEVVNIPPIKKFDATIEQGGGELKTYKDVLDKLNIDEKIVIPDDVMLDDDVSKISFDYQAPHGFNTTQVKEFQRAAQLSLAALVKMLKKRNVEIIKLSEELASVDDNSETLKKSIKLVKKIQKEKNTEIAYRDKEIVRLVELVNARNEELRISNRNRSRDSANMKILADKLEKMNNYLVKLNEIMAQKDEEIAKQREFIVESEEYISQKEEENRELQTFNSDLKQSMKILTEQREAREREEIEAEEREKLLRESQEKKLKEKITIYESEDDEEIIKDMMGVKSLISDREIEREIKTGNVEDKEIITEADFGFIATATTEVEDNSIIRKPQENNDTVDATLNENNADSENNNADSENNNETLVTEPPKTLPSVVKKDNPTDDFIDLEHSMKTIADDTDEIDFEKDLSPESAQEMQERKLLGKITMIEEEDSENFDMDELNDFLKNN